MLADLQEAEAKDLAQNRCNPHTPRLLGPRWALGNCMALQTSGSIGCFQETAVVAAHRKTNDNAVHAAWLFGLRW